MRIFVIPCCWLCLIVFKAVFTSAEAIHLKNGDTIYADQVREAGQNLQYEVGDNSFSIPKSKVQSIDRASQPELRRPVASELPALAPQSQPRNRNC